MYITGLSPQIHDHEKDPNNMFYYPPESSSYSQSDFVMELEHLQDNTQLAGGWNATEYNK